MSNEAPKPNPQPLEEASLTIEGVERYKRHRCKRYVYCLDVAAAAGWSQFHCNDCEALVLRANDDLSDQENQALLRAHQALVQLHRKRRKRNGVAVVSISEIEDDSDPVE